MNWTEQALYSVQFWHFVVPTTSFLTNRVLVITCAPIQLPKVDIVQRIFLYLVYESHLKLGVDV